MGARWIPAWSLAAIGAAIALRADVPLEWWTPLGAAIPGAIVALVASMALEQPRAVVHRVAAVLAGCVWVAVVARGGWGVWTVVALGSGAAIVAACEVAAGRGRAMVLRVGPAEQPGDRRPERVREWEAMLQRLTKRPVRVRDVRPWANPRDGLQVDVDLPEDMTVRDLSGLCDKIAGARRLPQGCVVRALDAEHQGAAILDVMLRDCLAVDGQVHQETTTPTSITEPIGVAVTARGEQLDVSLREQSMVIGGTTGSGKTTLLHRIIMRLARCTDTLIWIVDPNGGGVAAPWIAAWARGDASAPTIDWIAEDEVEAAVLVAVASAIVKDRKTSREATRRKRDANSHILPVDKDLPLIMVITDEGGELRQAAGLLATLVDEGLARLAQIGRAEGGRVIMSVLRGTADLLGKGLRSVAGVRVCLRMNEEGEYDHVLGVNPGRTRLLHRGSTYVYRTDVDHRPILGRTINVDLASIEAHSIATAHLRPQLDDRGRQVAARVTVRDVLDGRDPLDHPEIRHHPVMRDVEAGRAYEGRWERKARMLAELRGEELPDDEPVAPVLPERPTVAPVGSAAERLLLATGTLATPEPEPERVPARQLTLVRGEPEPRRPETAREAVLLVLRDARPDPLALAQVHAQVAERGVQVTAQRVHQVLTALAQRGEVRRDEAGRYELAS